MSEKLSSIKQPRLRPAFLHEFEALSEDVGVISAVHETLEQDGITVDIEGDHERLVSHEGGILLVGDHKRRFEFIAAADLVSQLGRDEMLLIGKFYVQHRVYKALGQAAADMVLPVLPSDTSQRPSNVAQS